MITVPVKLLPAVFFIRREAQGEFQAAGAIVSPGTTALLFFVRADSTHPLSSQHEHSIQADKNKLR